MKSRFISARTGAFAAILIASAATQSHAQVTVDGVRTGGEGYSELAVQGQVTQWGSSNSLANIHTEQTGKQLNLFVSGRADGNAIIVFIDSKAGGVQQITNNLIKSGGFEADINNLGDTNSTGLTFETGFLPDYAIRVYGGGDDAFAALYDLQKGFRVDLGQVDSIEGSTGSHGAVTEIRTVWQSVNTADHAAASSGIEISLNMALLGVAEGAQNVSLMAMLVNDNSSFGSNQVLGSLDTNDVIGSNLKTLDFETDYASVQTLTVGVNRPALVATDDEDGDGIANNVDPQPLEQTRDIEFRVNMAVQQAKNQFTVGSTVQVQFFSGSQTPLSTLTLTDPDMDLIYTGTLADAGGFEGESFGTYKFITNDPNSPNGGYEFGFDRSFNMGAPEVTQTLSTVFFSNDSTFPGYGTWANDNVEGQASNLDFDNDGIDNGAEYFMGTAGNAFTANPQVVAGQITWPRASGTTIASFKVEVSTDLGIWTDASVTYPGSVDTTNPNQVVFTLPTGLPKIFARLSVTP